MPLVPAQTRTLDDAIAFQARSQPGAVAARAAGHPDLTFGELAALSQRFTAALRSHGVGPRDRVILLLPMGMAASVAQVLVRAAAAAAPLDPDAPPAMLASFGQRLGARLAIVAPGMESLAEPLGCPTVALDASLRLPPGRAATVPGGMPGPDDPAVILATSGSTGAPRLVPRHHAQYFDVANLIARHHAFHPGATVLCAARPVHALGAQPLVSGIACGICTVFSPSTDPFDILATIRSGRPTTANLAPSTYESLLAAARNGAPVPPFEQFTSSAAPFPAAAAREVSALLGAPLVRDYGLSEANCLAFSGPDDEQDGVPRYRPMIPGSVAIADDDGAHLPPGETGEIVARGPHVFHGYLGGDGSEFFPGGWFRTGDLGVMAADGSFVVTGRLKHLVNRGGVKLSPPEIENVLLAHPGVAAAAVIPVPHPTLGEDIHAIIVPRPDETVTTREIRRWLLDRLPATHTPRAITIRDHLPMTASGKLDRMALIADMADQYRSKS